MTNGIAHYLTTQDLEDAVLQWLERQGVDHDDLDHFQLIIAEDGDLAHADSNVLIVIES